MEDMELINLWKSYGKTLEESLSLNRKNAEDITRMKVKSLLSSMRPVKVFAIVVGLIWVLFLVALLKGVYSIATPFFLIAAGAQAALTLFAVVVYVYQLILIQQVEIDEPILLTQEKLAKLKSSTIWVPRILFLQLPLWTMFYWNKSMLQNGNMILYIIQVLVTVGFLVLAIWLFRNISFANRDKKWFKLLFNGPEWTPLMKSMEMLEQVRDYK